MPVEGKRWYHITLGTHNSWLPGDPRGFRSRDHRIHSSGDHIHPPPPGEHAGLHEHSRNRSGEPILIPPDARPIVCEKLVTTLTHHHHRVLIVCVGGLHAHLLAELPAAGKAAKSAVGIAKKSASQAVRSQIAGQVWSRGCGLKPIRDEAHQHNTYRYIERHAGDGAAVWTFQGDPPRGG